MLQRELAEARQAQSEAQINIFKKKSGDYSREEEVDWSKGVAPNLLQESSRSRRYNKQAKDRRGQGSKHSLTSVTRSYCIRLTVPEHVIRNLSRISSCHMLLLVGPVT